MHTHEDAGEAFYVLEGEYLIFLDEQEFRCPAHGFRVGDVPSRKLNIYSPAAMVGYFDALERAAALSEPLDDTALVTMAARYNMRVLGPVLEGYS